MADLDLATLVTPKRFLELHPHLVTDHALRWQLRNRHSNGLAAAGAVLEVRQHAGQRRPKLLINPPRYADVLHDQHKYMRRAAGAA